jgi:fibronectin type 3 domain-containing protein
LLVLVLLALQVLPGGSLIGQGSVVTAATSPEDTSGIVVTDTTATGAALWVDAAMTITDVTVTATATTSLACQWEGIEGVTSYYLYRYDETTADYVFAGETTETSFSLEGLLAGEQYYVTVCGVNATLGYRSEFSAPVSAYTKPEKVESFEITGNTANSITLQWTDLTSATGYLIYRAGTGGNFKKIDATEMNQYTDTTVESGKTYQYKIITYAGTTDNVGEESPAVFTCSLPEAPVLTVKGGNQRVRLTWAAITGATGYHVYLYENDQYVLVTTLEGKASKKYLHTGLENDVTYQYYVTAYRTYNDVTYESAASNIGEATTQEVAATSTEPKLFSTKAAFKKSDAYKKCTDFKKKVNYSKSFAMPGMISTNVAEFNCTTMIPQGLTYAKSCFFMTAYDSKGVENSVVYVLDGSSRELLTTIILPNKSHAGGIAFDGKNLWITQAKTLRSIPYSAVSDAIENEEAYVELDSYGVEIDLPQQAATVTYYKKLLWVASYDELNPGYLVSYKITDKSTTPSLTALNTIKMPTRVQGIAFTKNGRLLVSRSCQTDATQRGYMHQIDVYKPNLKKAASGVISLGKTRRVITMPTMNEEIAVSGSYVYTVFESVSFSKATMRMDRVCALPLSFVTKLSK